MAPSSALVLVGLLAFSVGLVGCDPGQALRSNGDAASGGVSGTGGATGGTSAAGGGGAGGAAGGAGGGTGGSGGGTALPPITGTAIAPFDTTTEGFLLDNYHDISVTNLADLINPANPPPTVSFDGTEGSPTPGSLLLGVPFSGANQYVDIEKVFGPSMLADWSGRTLHVRVRVSQGTFKGGAQPYVKTSASYVFAGTYAQLAPGSAWQDLTLNLTSPMNITSGYDPRQVIAFGLQLNSGAAGAGSTPVTFNVDSFVITPPLVPPPETRDAGADTPGD